MGDDLLSRPACGCHGQPMYWTRRSRDATNGYWRCAVTHRDKAAARYADAAKQARKLQRQRDRYDSDPIYRIEKRLADDARRRRHTLKRRREQFHLEHMSSLVDDQ